MWEAGDVGGWGCGRLGVWEAGSYNVYKTRDVRSRKGTVEGKTWGGWGGTLLQNVTGHWLVCRIQSQQFLAQYVRFHVPFYHEEEHLWVGGVKVQISTKTWGCLVTF